MTLDAKIQKVLEALYDAIETKSVDDGDFTITSIIVGSDMEEAATALLRMPLDDVPAFAMGLKILTVDAPGVIAIGVELED